MKKHVGSSVASLFEETGEIEHARLLAAKKIVAEQLRRAMERGNVSQVVLATRMETSRTVVQRLLDPSDTSVTLATLATASSALGLELDIRLQRRAQRPRTSARAARVRPSRSR